MAPTRRFLQATASAAALTALIASASPAFAESAAGRLGFGIHTDILFPDRDTDLNAPGGTTRIDVSRKGYTITGQLAFYF